MYRSSKANCVRNKPIVEKPIKKFLPGSAKSRDEQCAKTDVGYTAYKVSFQISKNVYKYQAILKIYILKWNMFIRLSLSRGI